MTAYSTDGQATRNNCMLLRADLHRLFDAGLLGFDLGGKVLLNKEVAAHYPDLHDKKLDDNVFKFVDKALAAYRVF